VSKPAWTRRTRIEKLNQNVLFHFPRWTAEDIARQRRAVERIMARLPELAGETPGDSSTVE
jgi:hypothetical protein